MPSPGAATSRISSGRYFAPERNVPKNPAKPKQLIKAINEWGSVLEASQRLALQVLGTLALIYLVIRAILR